ncbi:MAG TPA: putative quinol monooxygenase, partial [Chloroflexota bacterium]|nr:putative quinol monooxygenase [Chloroflexota bacterium]
MLVTIEIKPEFRDRFLEEMILNAKGSRENEPGCLQFDVVQDEVDQNKIYLYEIYNDRAAFDAHVQMPHYFKWRDAVKDWRSSPQVAVKGFT